MRFHSFPKRSTLIGLAIVFGSVGIAFSVTTVSYIAVVQGNWWGVPAGAGLLLAGILVMGSLARHQSRGHNVRKN